MATADTVLYFFNLQFPHFGVQTRTERDRGELTDPAYIAYDDFYMYWNIAKARLASDLKSHNLVLSEYESIFCLACLIADMREKGNPDWSYASITVDPGDGAPKISITRGSTDKTGYQKAYDDVIDDAKRNQIKGAIPFNGTKNLDATFTRDFAKNLNVPF